MESKTGFHEKEIRPHINLEEIRKQKLERDCEV